MKYSYSWIFFIVLCSFNVGATENPSAHVPGSGPNYISPDYSDNLLGDWGGRRADMSARGYDWELLYKLDLLSNTASTSRNSYALDNLDVKLALDGEKIFGIAGGSGLLYILSNQGGKPAIKSDRLPHGVDNIETPENANTVKLYQAWLQQTFLDEKLSILAGLYDLNSEFYVNEAAGIFIHPTFGIGAEFAGTGKNGPSIFPNTSLAIRVKAELARGYYLMAATMDGVPGDPNNPHGTHLQFNQGDGALNVIEAEFPLGISDDPHDNKMTFGVWRYTAHFDDLLDQDVNAMPIQRVSQGYYFTAEKVFGYSSITNEESWRGFIRAGKNDGNTTQFDMAWSAGLSLEAPFADRDKDIVGIAVAQERNAVKYRAVPGNSQVTHENSFELTYRYHAMGGVVLQPVVQYLLNHSNDPAQDKSWWLGMRFEVSL